MIEIIIIYTKEIDFKYTKQSIEKNLKEEYTITVLAPKDAFIDKGIKTIYYENKDNLTQLINTTILESPEEISFIIKSGCYITPKVFDILKIKLNENNINISVPKINSIFKEQNHEFSNVLENQILLEALKVSLGFQGEVTFTKDIDDNFLGIKKSVFKALGGFDEGMHMLPLTYRDYLYRSFQNEFNVVVCNDALVYARNLCDTSAFVSEEASKLTSKLKVHSGYYSVVRDDLFDLIQENPIEDLTILDVGCGAGYTLLSLKNIYKNAEVYGIEKIQACKNLASPLINMKIGDCMDLIEDFEDESIDYIILTEVLDELSNPWEFLRKCYNKLSGSGKIVASINNIANISVIYELVNGIFTYKSQGVLDINKLRFFTLNTMLSMFNQNGYNVVSITAARTGGAYEDMLISEIMNSKIINKEIPQNLDLASQFKVSQYNFLCTKVVQE